MGPSTTYSKSKYRLVERLASWLIPYGTSSIGRPWTKRRARKNHFLAFSKWREPKKTHMRTSKAASHVKRHLAAYPRTEAACLPLAAVYNASPHFRSPSRHPRPVAVPVLATRRRRRHSFRKPRFYLFLSIPSPFHFILALRDPSRGEFESISRSRGTFFTPKLTTILSPRNCISQS